MKQKIFNFSDVKVKKIKDKKKILGGKGANLAEMGRLGLPFPLDLQFRQKYVIFYKNKKNYLKEFFKDIQKN